MTFKCYDCGRLLVSAASRGSHKKWCQGYLDVEIEDMTIKISNGDDADSENEDGSYSFPHPDDEYDELIEHELSDEDMIFITSFTILHLRIEQLIQICSCCFSFL